MFPDRGVPDLNAHRIETVAALQAAIPSFTTEQLLEEAQFTFGYYGNAVHNRQVEREDDAIARFNVVKTEIGRRLLSAAGGQGDQAERSDDVTPADAHSAHEPTADVESTVVARAVTPGEGWVLLADGDMLMEGDGFMHPDHTGWIDFVCRPDVFRGENEKVHSGWAWRRRVAQMAVQA